MTQKEIQEGNKLIAFFMTEEPAVLKRDLKKAGTLESMHYHDSWDWLMPVVEKILSLPKYRMNLKADYYDQYQATLFYGYGMGERVRDTPCDMLIGTIWGAVVEFIKWYNKNNK